MEGKIKVGSPVFDSDFGNGKVIAIQDELYWPYAVRFDKKMNGLHCCNGITDKGYVLYWSKDEIKELHDNYNKLSQ